MDQLRTFDIIPLNIEDIHPRLLDDFSHFQKITKKYVKTNGVWEISDASILREWSTEKRIWITKYMCQQIERGGLTAGAFVGGRLVGFCCMDGYTAQLHSDLYYCMGIISAAQKFAFEAFVSSRSSGNPRM